MSVLRVTDLDVQITSPRPLRGRVTDHHPTGSSRLQELLALRAQLDTEIARERAFQRRFQTLKTAAAAASSTPVVWERRVLEAAAAAFEVTVEELLGRGRTRQLVAARAATAWVLHREGWSQVKIGRLLERDHTTIGNLLRHVEELDELQAAAWELSAAAGPLVPQPSAGSVQGAA